MTNITDPQIHRKPIIFGDIEFATSPTECIRALAYHRQELCTEREWWGKAGGVKAPAIRRYRTYVNGKRVCSTVVCEACGIFVARAARRELEKLSLNVVEVSFGPLTKNIRTDYYIPVPSFTGEKKTNG